VVIIVTIYILAGSDGGKVASFETAFKLRSTTRVCFSSRSNFFEHSALVRYSINVLQSHGLGRTLNDRQQIGTGTLNKAFFNGEK
jgi:hypothetical protein